MTAANYYPVYLVVVALLTLYEVMRYARLNATARLHTEQRYQGAVPLIILTAAVTLFVGLRPISGVFIDMKNYETFYYFLRFNDVPDHFTYSNFIFDNLFIFWAQQQWNLTLFYFTMALLYFVPAAVAMWRIFPHDAFYAFVVFLGAFSTFSYGTNGIKAGVAASLFLLALSFYRDRKWLSILFVVLSYGFHHSMQLPMAAFVVCSFYRNTKAYMALWVLCLVLAAAHVTYFQTLFGGMTDEQGAKYLMESAEGVMRKSGFRLDFIIYSAIPIAIGWWALARTGFRSTEYTFFYNIYLFVNAIWMLCMYAPFTNRIAYLSWQLLPLISILLLSAKT